jgi:hypothetical protein
VLVATKKPLNVHLPEELARRLDAFCEAHYDAPATRVICEALTRFIDERLEAEPQMRVRYDEARRRAAPSPVRKLSSVPEHHD